MMSSSALLEQFYFGDCCKKSPDAPRENYSYADEIFRLATLVTMIAPIKS
jgi:hypothetical protein